MSIINKMLNDESKSKTTDKVIDIPLEDIEVNEFNRAPICNIEDLIFSIKEMGLQQPLLVYKRANHDYVLLNGERRYNAVKMIGWEDVPAIVIEKPEDEVKERLIILEANSQRDELQDYKKQRAREYAEIYAILKSQGKIKSGMLKIDWIGFHMNLSGRQIQRLLKEDVDGEQKKKEKDTEVSQYALDVRDELKCTLETAVTISKNKISISYTNDNDLKEILDRMTYIKEV